MKLRKEKIDITDEAERDAVEAVRRLAAASQQTDVGSPPPEYFANMLVRANQRIDVVTSGKALSISWLARVAVPGVVAILFFFIGLHYYAPTAPTRNTIASAVSSLPADAIDSLLTESVASGSLTAADINGDLFEVSDDQLADFYIVSGNPGDALEAFSDNQVDEVASILESRTINL
jgi:hypothetical protein